MHIASAKNWYQIHLVHNPNVIDIRIYLRDIYFFEAVN